MINILEWENIQTELRESKTRNYMRLETILLIEDNEELSESLAIRLRQDGYEVILATDGVEGLSLIEELDPDLVVLDLGLPRMSGMKVLESIRETYGDLPVPVIVLTGNRDSRLKVRIKNFGVETMLCKPVRQKYVSEAIRNTLSGE